MTFAYGKPLHRGKLMRPRCVGNLKRAYIFIAAYHLKYRTIIVPFHLFFVTLLVAHTAQVSTISPTKLLYFFSVFKTSSVNSNVLETGIRLENNLNLL